MHRLHLRPGSLRRFVVTVILGIVVSCSLAGCGAAIPDMRGTSVEQATRVIESAGLRVGKVTYDEKAIGAAGIVVAQLPEAGKQTKKDALVFLIVAGHPPVATPDLSNLDTDKAATALTASGLKLGGVSESYGTSVTAGRVASQTPDAGAHAPKGSAVAVVISKGPQPVRVPSVKGKSQAVATKALQSAGFKVKSEQQADTAKKGTVIAQKPASGESPPGSTVTIMVSSGLVRVPDVVAASAAYAKRQPENAFFGENAVQVWDAHDAYIADLLKACGLRCQVELENGWLLSNSAKAHQTPKAGQLVQPGTMVKLVLPVWD